MGSGLSANSGLEILHRGIFRSNRCIRIHTIGSNIVVVDAIISGRVYTNRRCVGRLLMLGGCPGNPSIGMTKESEVGQAVERETRELREGMTGVELESLRSRSGRGGEQGE